MTIDRRSILVGAGAAALAGGAMTRAAQPDAFHPGEVWNDTNGVAINAHGGGLLRHGGRWWWHGEHKTAGEAGNTALVGVHAYSSADLVNWRDEGVALPVSDDPDSPITRGCILERPKVVYNRRTGKFVMWFHLELKGRGYGAAQAGVAVADRPQGPFRFLRAGRVNPGIWPANATAGDKASDTKLAQDMPGGQMARDMTIFVDGDIAWHVYASEENATLQIARLAPDWTSHDGYYVRALPDGGNEAPALFKAKGRYYMFASGLTGWRPNPGRVYVADRVTGPWRSLGNPVRGSEEDRKTTFHSQSTLVLPLPPERPGAEPRFIFMADRWRPENAIDGRYVWLPVEWEGETPVMHWRDRWTLADGWKAK
ncbi:glycoside hydrolase family 43 protein [Sphingomonas parapaucimobilis]|uniref:Putative hydrolase n=1 Tax=Sphingomonas parapaucimobilis NBRC 15100 TaxID=1219049 RepID=A0A0A1W645_9SPHN|nr:glycoside hydrolase family 43 protein [Sphingomonas parapaucimobilis]GAM00359.1 putative hydrolase [Sphingomonas parapaucimobilis NBRC 15100]